MLKFIPPLPGDTLYEDAFSKCRMNAACIQSTMQATILDYKRTDFYHRLTLFLTKNLPRNLACKKIVVFGGGAMSFAKPIVPWKINTVPPTPPIYPNDQPLRCQMQHAAVLSIRNTLEIHFRKPSGLPPGSFLRRGRQKSCEAI